MTASAARFSLGHDSKKASRFLDKYGILCQMNKRMKHVRVTRSCTAKSGPGILASLLHARLELLNGFRSRLMH
jgi:hypothetical protein